MIKTLASLDEDPRKWPNPPQKEEDVEYAREFRENAINYFQSKADYGLLINKYGKDYVEEHYRLLRQFF